MKLSFKEFLFETKLSPTEFVDKVASNGDYANESRPAILRKLIDAKEPLVLDADDSEITIDASHPLVKQLMSLLPDDRNPTEEEKRELKLFLKNEKPFITVDGEAYKISDIKKSKAFGGESAGSGGGAAATKQNESSQCVATAIACFLDREIDKDDFNIKNVEAIEKKIDISFSYSDPAELVKALTSSASWQKTFISTANILRKELKLSEDHMFHHKSSWVTSLGNIYKKLNKNDDSPFGSMDKWNPADIWIVKKNIEIPEDFDSLVELNTWLADKFDEKEVIGVSLKKTSSSADFKIKNAESIANELGDIDLPEFSISDKKDRVFIGKNSYIYFGDEELQLKSTQTNYSSIQGTINKKGSAAQHGGISLGPINKILKHLSLPEVSSLETVKSLIDLFEDDKLKKYSVLLKSFINIIEKANPSLDKDKIKTEFLNSSKTDSAPWVVSKYQAVELISILQQATEKERKEFVFHAFAYAASQSELSSIHVKVS